jgi:hypothetical protein
MPSLVMTSGFQPALTNVMVASYGTLRAPGVFISRTTSMVLSR